MSGGITTMPLSLVDALRARIERHPQRDALIFIGPSGAAEPISYGQLDRDAQRGAGRLQAAGVQPGEVVILAFEHSYELVAAFWGALYAGAVPAIFPYPEAIPDAESRRQRLRTLAEFTGTHTVICPAGSMDELAAWLAGSSTAPLALTEATPTPGAWTPSQRGGEDLAYLQFSSGATGQPKGVMLSHRTVLNNICAQIEHWRFTERDVCVNWLPFYHDMGLLIGLLLPLLNSALSVSIPPSYWVRRPQALFRAIHHYRGSMTWMPNFAFHHCLRTIRDEDLAGLDLASWRIVGNGSEPVQAELMRRFAERFASWGLVPTALTAGYGMAENVVAVASTRPEQHPRVDFISVAALQEQQRAQPVPADQPGVKAIVSCGPVLPSVQVRVVDETGLLLPARCVGEIVVGGSSIFSGYFHDPERTGHALRDGWFHTGDLGYLADGELYICDRKQDLIIVGGRNIFPESIEDIARETLAEQARHVVAFGVADATLGTETPVLVCEGRPGLAAEPHATLAEQVRQGVSQALGVTLADVYFAPRGWIVRTTSGKLARSACRDKYLAAGFRPELPGLALLRTADDDPVLLEQALTALVGGMLGLEAVAPHDSFFALGGDSLTALRFVLAVEEASGRRVPTEFFREPTVAHLARLLAGDEPAVVDSSAPQGDRLQERQRRLLPVRQRLRRRLIDIGPVWHGHALPYGLGVRLQRAWLALPGLRERLFGRQIQVLRRWSEMVGEPLSEEAIQCSLLANTWRKWRNYVLAAPLGASPWVTLLGDPALWQPQPKSPGAIFLVMHTPLHRVFLQGLVAGGSKVLAVRNEAGGWDTRTQDRALTLHRAYAALRRGETVVIAGDGGKGGQGVLMPFYGGQRLFRQGAAELAVQTGARLVPVFCMIAPNGHVTIEVNAPLVGEHGTDESRATTLTRTYAEMLVARWPQFCPFWEWRNMEVWLDRLARGRA